MLRTIIAAVAAVAAVGLAAAPAAEAAPRICASNCSGTSSTGSGGAGTSSVVRGPNKPPNASQSPRAIAAHRVADPITKRIIDKINKIRSHFG